MEVRKAIRSGQLCPSYFNYKPDEWCQKMRKRDAWVDHSWLEMAAQYLDRDIIIIPLHTLASGELYHLISAGLLSGQGRGRNAPIFIGNYLHAQLHLEDFVVTQFFIGMKTFTVFRKAFHSLNNCLNYKRLCFCMILVIDSFIFQHTLRIICTQAVTIKV